MQEVVVEHRHVMWRKKGRAELPCGRVWDGRGTVVSLNGMR